ncbi:hypothetical protein Rhopal_005396-T1 [Rhodotorula paludigena]|uniref:Inhibitor I9 domain-containing protein n=1 Tax=Rhodotorula paludigena TaxID=86838 RepID=A0AAV5GS78_9BASI|nr:hypothetical protein Rhopal_005396-T1 [Rhodotorula paludigena]
MSGTNSYIVVFKPESDGPHASADAISDLASKVEGSGGNIKHHYDSKVMRGFAGSFSEDLKSELEQHPGVKYIEPDGAVSTM